MQEQDFQINGQWFTMTQQPNGKFDISSADGKFFKLCENFDDVIHTINGLQGLGNAIQLSEEERAEVYYMAGYFRNKVQRDISKKPYPDNVRFRMELKMIEGIMEKVKE